MGRMDKGALIEEACQELLTYGVWSGKTRLKYLIKKYLMKHKMAPEDPVFWPTGLLAAGLWYCRQELCNMELCSKEPGNQELNSKDLGNQELDNKKLCNMESGSKESGSGQSGRTGVEENGSGTADALEPDIAMIDLVLGAYYDRWFGKKCKILWLDDLLAGETLLEMYEEYSKKGRDGGSIRAKDVEKYRQAVEKLADYGLSYPTDETGSCPYRAGQDNGFVFVDTIGLACPFLYRYGAVYDKRETMELAVKQIVNFLAYGMDITTGLPYHGYSIADDCKYGIIGWGRATGWLMRGMAGCMTTEYGAGRLRDSYIKLADAALPYQRRDGYFSWQLQAMEGPADTSATGMICASLKQGIELGILHDQKYGQALQAGRTAIEKSVRNGRVYDCSGECEGFGQYPQRYGAYPWALGAALML